MTEPWWSDPEPEVTYSEIMFGSESFVARMPISRELLDDPAHAGDRERIIRSARDEAVYEFERAVRVANLPSGAAVLGVEVVIPYAFTVPMHLPRTWWERLLGRPARVVSVAVGGTLHADARVRVDVAATFRFPEFDQRFGPAVPTGAYELSPRPVQVVHVDTYPRSGPHVVTSRVLHRCAEPGCGHYAASHVPADEIEPGGCTIDDCECRWYPTPGAGMTV